MKVISTKIVDGKKMFLIEEPTKLFAQNGFSSNSYYVPIQGSISDNTKTKLSPKKELSKEEIKQLQKSPTSVKNIKAKEVEDKNQRLKLSEQAYQKRKTTGIQSSQDLANETGAIGDKIALQNIPYVGKYIPNILDVTQGIGNMASGLGRIPLNLEKGNYGQAALDVAMPLGVGALAGVSANTTGEFINNIVNPLAGTGDLINNLGNKYLPNAYKLNPWALKENPEMLLYRARPVGQNPDMNMAAQLKAKEAAGEPLKWYQKNLLNPQTNPEIIAREKYYGRWFEKDPNRLDFYIDPGRRNFADEETIEILRTKLPKSDAAKLNASQFDDAKLLSLSPETEFILPKEMINSAERFPESSWQQLIQEDRKFNTPNWLRGYKEVPKPASNFKSEIDWGKWNKEIPENKALMKEYNDIEQTAKANGTWMKNSDGSAFQGTPEQFVQQNSSNFKKAFPEGFTTGYRGAHQHIDDFANRDLNAHTATFLTDSKANAETYATSDGLPKTYYHPEVDVHPAYDPKLKGYPLNYEDGIYQLAFPKNLPKVVGEGRGNNWRFLDYDENIANNINPEHLKNDHEFRVSTFNSPKKNSSINTTYPNDFTIDKKYLTTDNYATYVKNNPIGIAEIKNVSDQMGNVPGISPNTIYAIDANKVPIKSLMYNNGMFDMTNPNIYKSIVGALATGTLGKKAMEKKEFGGTIKVLDTKIEGNKKMYLIED